MRIGIITCWNSSDNYGQLLQCYALQTLLRSWGHDAFLIRYAPVWEKKPLFMRIFANLQDPQRILRYLPFPTSQRKIALRAKKLKNENKRLNVLRRFDEFREQYLSMTEKIYCSYEELSNNPPDADIYIAGSDQVWHDPYSQKAIYGWFLQFGDNKVKRLSYAASIGRNLEKWEIPLFRQFLSRFDAISVREDSAREFCHKQGFNVQVCIDPTMLLKVNHYRELAIPLIENNSYAFIYVLNVETTDDFYWEQIKDYISKENLSIKSVSATGYYPALDSFGENVNLLATIPEWLSYINGARCVFTTSFHGMVFAILMHRPFLVIGLKGSLSQSNIRIVSLLTALGIPERIYNPQLLLSDQMETPIDWDIVEKRLADLQKSSIEFLYCNIEKSVVL